MFLDRLLEIFGMDGVSDKRKLTSAKAEAEKLAVIEQGLEIKRLQALHDRYVGVGFFKRKIEATPEQEFDLGTARTNLVIDDRGGQIIFITQCTGTAYFRFDGVAKPTYTAKVGVMTVPFEKLYLTNTAQAGKKLTMIIGQDPSVSFVTDPVTGELQSMLAELQTSVAELQNLPNKATSPLIENVTMASGNTEYSYTFPDNTKTICMGIHLGQYAFRIAWVTGKVATPTQPYVAIAGDKPYERWGLNLIGKTVYFACSEPNREMMIESYT